MPPGIGGLPLVGLGHDPAIGFQGWFDLPALLEVATGGQGRGGDIGKVGAFINQVNAFRKAGILTIAQADSLVAGADTLLLTLSLTYRGIVGAGTFVERGLGFFRKS